MRDYVALLVHEDADTYVATGRLDILAKDDDDAQGVLHDHLRLSGDEGVTGAELYRRATGEFVCGVERED